MTARHGKPYSPKELLWLAAANTLAYDVRLAAINDIADMAERSCYPVRIKADALRRESDQEMLERCKSETAGGVPHSRIAGYPEPRTASGFKWKRRTNKSSPHIDAASRQA